MSPSGSHINIEIKAKSDNHDKTREILESLKADFKGTDSQTDTYFNVNKGRLKLREGDIENNLIYYEREDERGPKQSNVILYKSNPGSTLKEILIQALGIMATVKKQREIYFVDNVKFHLDTINKLGTFVEIEVVDKDGTIGNEELLKQCNHYMNLFNINNKDLISVSYSDLLLPK